jgi:hypothetical protein
MSPASRRVLTDYVTRTRKWLCLGAFCYVVIVYPMSAATDQRQLLLGPMLVAFLFRYAGRGWTRTLLTLPMSLKEAGRAVWWVTVGIPGFGFAILNLFVVLVASVLGWKTLALWQIGIWTILIWGFLGLLMLGSIFPGWNVSNILISILTIPFLIILATGLSINSVWLPVVGAAAVAGILAAGHSYVRPSALALRQLGRSRKSVVPGSKKGLASRLFRTSGWSVVAFRYGSAALLVSGVLAAVSMFPPLFSAFNDRSSPIGQWLPILSALSPLLLRPWLASARAFRSLPLTGDRLSIIILAAATAAAGIIISTIILGCGALSIQCDIPKPPSAFAYLWTPMLVPALLLRFGGRTNSETGIVFSGIFLGFAGPAIVTAAHMPTAISLLLTGLIGFACFLWTRHELRAGRNAYRVHRAGAFASGDVEIQV